MGRGGLISRDSKASTTCTYISTTYYVGIYSLFWISNFFGELKFTINFTCRYLKVICIEITLRTRSAVSAWQRRFWRGLFHLVVQYVSTTTEVVNLSRD